TVTVAATAADNVGVAGVQFRLDGTPLGAEDTTAPYSISWNTTAVADGVHVLTAVARDTAGNTATAANVSVTVANADTVPPTVSLTSPADGATVSGTVAVTAGAAANAGGVAVQGPLSGQPLGTEDTTSPYAITWNTATAANGTHQISAVARDAAGNQTTSAAVAVTTSNGDITPPAISAVYASAVVQF